MIIAHPSHQQNDNSDVSRQMEFTVFLPFQFRIVPSYLSSDPTLTSANVYVTRQILYTGTSLRIVIQHAGASGTMIEWCIAVRALV